MGHVHGNRIYCENCKKDTGKDNQAMYVNRWIAENRDRFNSYVTKSYYKNREKWLNRSKIWRQKNRSKYNETQRRYRERKRKELGKKENYGIKWKVFDKVGRRHNKIYSTHRNLQHAKKKKEQYEKEFLKPFYIKHLTKEELPKYNQNI